MGAFSPEAWAQAATATGVRNFPRSALRGTLVVLQPPAIQIDGNAMRLSPGARIHATNNSLVFSAQIVGQELVVNYTLEPGGMVHEAWILTPQEAALKRPNTQQQGYSSRYDTAAPADDGKTPYNQLPGYGTQTAPDALANPTPAQ